MADIYKFKLDKNEVLVFKELLTKLKSREPTIQIRLNGEIRGLAQNLLEELHHQEEFYKYDRW